MIKKLLYGLLTILIGGILFVVFFLADRKDAELNPVLMTKPYTFTPRAEKLFQSLDFVADLHCDFLMWQRDLNDRHDFGHFDIPRMQEGNVAFQALTMVTKSPKNMNIHSNSDDTDRITLLVMGQGKPVGTWFSLMSRAAQQCRKFNRAVERNSFFHSIGNKDDFKQFLDLRQKDKRHVSGFLGVEGAHCMEGKMENMERLYELGVRMVGPAHFFDSEMGGSAHGMEKGGLTEFGKDVMAFAQKKGLIIDLAHSSNQVIDEVLEYENVGILNSHTGVKGTHNTSRNLSDEQILKIASKGGLIGIGFFSLATGAEGIPPIVKAMKYTKELVGAEHVALGSDFDGTVEVPFDITGLALLVEEMLVQGFTEEEIRLIMGENVKRFLLKWLPE